MNLKFKHIKQFAEVNIEKNYYEEIKQIEKNDLKCVMSSLNMLLIVANIIVFVLLILLQLLNIKHREFSFEILLFFPIVSLICSTLGFFSAYLFYLTWLNTLKSKNREELLNLYLNYKYNFDLSAIYALNNLRANDEMLVKRRYELLDFDSKDTISIQFKDDNQFKSINHYYDDESKINYIKKQAQHTKLSLKELQDLLKYYVMIVQQNKDNFDQESMNHLKISNNDDLYQIIEKKCEE